MKVRKKPIIVNAWQLDHRSSSFPDWVDQAIDNKILFWLKSDLCWEVVTIEGSMMAWDGDYLIQGVRKELYPCNKSIFEETYQIVSD